MAHKITFIGGGNMARCLLGGLVARGAAPADLAASEPQDALRQALARDFGIRTGSDNAALAAGADVVVLAVKPQVMGEVCRGIAPAIAGAGATVVSIAAGVRLAQFARWFGAGQAVVRAMPNTPALLGCGISGLVANPAAGPAARAAAEAVLAPAGPVVWIADEALMDAVTAVSGSGPAYFFLLMEAMQAAAQRQGLPADVAAALVRQTALGAARMATEGTETPSRLRERVTSPGGTTQAALEAFEAGAFRALVDAAIDRATVRGRELSELLGD